MCRKISKSISTTFNNLNCWGRIYYCTPTLKIKQKRKIISPHDGGTNTKSPANFIKITLQTFIKSVGPRLKNFCLNFYVYLFCFFID